MPLFEKGICVSSPCECCLGRRKSSSVEREGLASPALVFREFSESPHCGGRGIFIEVEGKKAQIQ